MTADTDPACDDSPAFRAFGLLARCRRIGRKQLLAAHALLCPDAAGVGGFRRHGCQVRCPRTGVVLYTAPDAACVSALVDDFVDFINDPGENTDLPFVALLRLLRIHPFSDGNGRLARVLFAALCWREGRRHPAWLLALRRLYRFDGQAIRSGSFAVGESGDWRPYLAACDRAQAEATAIWQESDVDRCGSGSADALAALWARCSDGFAMPPMARDGHFAAPPEQSLMPAARPASSCPRIIRPSMRRGAGSVLLRTMCAVLLAQPLLPQPALGQGSDQNADTLPTTTVWGTAFGPRFIAGGWGGGGWGGGGWGWSGGDTERPQWDPQFDPNAGDNEQVRDAAEKTCPEMSGNPVVVTTGNKIESFLDFQAGGEMGLYLSRTYNHYWQYLGLFGRHWITNFDYSLVRQGGSVLWAQRPDGRRIKFVLNTANNRFEEDKAVPVAYIVRHADGSYTHYTEERTVETYDEFGYVQTVKNRQDVGWTFSYAGNRLQQVTHTSGRNVQFTWTNGQLTRVTDPDGAHYDFTYDEHQFGFGQHRLTAATLPGTPTTLVDYHYEHPAFPGALTGLSYAGAHYSTYAYDADGMAVGTAHAGGQHAFEFVYDGALTPPVDPPYDPPPPGGSCDPETGLCVPPQAVPPPDLDAAALERRTRIAQAAQAILAQRVDMTSVTQTNPLGKVTEYQFEDGRLARIDGEASTHCPASFSERSYGPLGYVDEITDFNGNIAAHDYNGQGQLQSLTEGHGSPVARSTSVLWDEEHNRIDEITLTGDHVQTFTWRADHRLGAVTVRNLSAHGVANQEQTIDYSYTFHGNGLVATMVEDGPLPGAGDAITSTYSAQGDLTQVRNSRNHAVAYSQHNGRGQPGRIVGANGDATEFQYDGRGRITRVRSFRDGGQQDTVYAYNAGGLLDSVATPDGVTESYTYDAARRLKTLTRNEPDGSAVREFVYDDAGNLVRDEIRRGGTLAYRVYLDYDELDRVRARRGNDGQHQRYVYDLNGNLTQLLRVHGGLETPVMAYEYDALNRPSRQTDSEGGSTAFVYNPADRIVQVTDPRNRVTSYGIDGFGQLWTHTSQDTGTTSQQWSPGGLRTSATRADTVTLNYDHDELGRPTTVTAGGQTHTTVWDTGANCGFGIGRICRIDDPHQSLELGYGRYGELTLQRPTIAGQAGYLHRFHYDVLGRLNRIEYPNAVEVSYSRTLDRITGMTATINGVTQTLATSIQYAPMGGVTRIDYGSGGWRQQAWDTDGRLTGIATDMVQGLGYAYDDRNRIEAITNFANGAWSQGFTYDDADRLTGVTSAGLADQTLQYDASGNRTSHALAGRTATYAVNPASNWLTGITGAITRGYTHKATGQILTLTGSLHGGPWIFRNGFEAAQTYTFGYDPFNRLASVTGPRVDAQYKVAATGMRVEKTASGRTTRFVYGLDGALLHEHDTADGRRSHHLYLHGQPIGLVRDDQAFLVLPDHLGRPEVVADADNKDIRWRAIPEAFERRVIVDEIGGYHLGFPGQYHDAETGFAYNVHRDYDPATGRYIQSDPIGLNGGINTYAYAASSPVMAIDPLGLACNQHGCWNTPDERSASRAGDWAGYYALACAGKDQYACRAGEVAGNRGFLSGVTNTRLARSIARNLPTGTACEASRDETASTMEAIRVELMKARVAQLTGASRAFPLSVPRQSIADFHHDVFTRHGAEASVFGGDLWDSIPGSRTVYDWCPEPSCVE